MPKTRLITASSIAVLCVTVATARPAVAAPFSILVKSQLLTGLVPSGSQSDSATVTQFFDPALTNWVAWNDLIAPTTANAGCTAFVGGLAGQCLGNHGFGTDDFIRMTVTNPLGASLTVDMDINNASAVSSGPQMVLFGTAANAPDVRRMNGFSGSFSVFNESGAFNALFTAAGNYQFDFSFRALHCCTAGHGPVYLLADLTPPTSVPEPTTAALLGLGLVSVWRARRRARS